jgi:alkylhydroperoxidase family enzyme
MPSAAVIPRIAPVAPPYPPDVDAALRAMMPRDVPIDPLRLFRTLVVHPQLAAAMHALGRFVLGRELAVGVRARELLIDRTTARCGAEYEWGVHASFFAARAGLSAEQVHATVHGDAASPVWSDVDRLLVRLADELHETATVSDALWAELRARWTPPELLELVLVVGWYHAIAFLVNAVRVEREPWAPAFPAPDVAGT